MRRGELQERPRVGTEPPKALHGVGGLMGGCCSAQGWGRRAAEAEGSQCEPGFTTTPIPAGHTWTGAQSTQTAPAQARGPRAAPGSRLELECSISEGPSLTRGWHRAKVAADAGSDPLPPAPLCQTHPRAAANTRRISQGLALLEGYFKAESQAVP